MQQRPAHPGELNWCFWHNSGWIFNQKVESKLKLVSFLARTRLQILNKVVALALAFFIYSKTRFNVSCWKTPSCPSFNCLREFEGSPAPLCVVCQHHCRRTASDAPQLVQCS